MKTYTKKLVLDAAMTAAYAVLMVYSLTGALYHEILALILAALLAIHIAVNIRLLPGMLRAASSANASMVKARLALDALSCVTMSAALVTGVLVSKFLFTGVAVKSAEAYSTAMFLHGLTAWAAFAVMSVHIGLHWHSILAAVTKRRPQPGSFSVIGIICKLTAAVMVVMGVRTAASIRLQLPVSADETAAASESESEQPRPLYETKNANPGSAGYTGSVEALDCDTVEEFLSKLTCTGCGNRCLLSSPRCARGFGSADTAASAYESAWSAYDAEIPPQDAAESQDAASSSDAAPGDAADAPDDTSALEDSSGLDDMDSDETRELSLFSDILPSMGMYIAATYYAVSFKKRQS